MSKRKEMFGVDLVSATMLVVRYWSKTNKQDTFNSTPHASGLLLSER
jgi:hypothetical protein